MNAGLQLDKVALWAYTRLNALATTKALQMLVKQQILPWVKEMVIAQVIDQRSCSAIAAELE
ncbi:MAG: hypothetical protein KME40_09020 [Komarekiella atlantica HA4396-MV6]|jgi:hypothetical protein|nr:hypothetical protein [Komarekiella atlantica HA4396-MV6]